MALEHRWSQRLEIRWKGSVYHRQAGLAAVNLVNIGMDGAFIAGRNLILARNDCVELGFVAANSDKLTIHHLQAYVIHATGNGYGLMFKDFRFSPQQPIAGVPNAA